MLIPIKLSNTNVSLLLDLALGVLGYRADIVDALDVDGNGWSSRFHRLIMSGSMVIKATIYQEWNSDWMIPWYHYVVSVPFT